jgi:hypothetical protein
MHQPLNLLKMQQVFGIIPVEKDVLAEADQLALIVLHVEVL